MAKGELLWDILPRITSNFHCGSSRKKTFTVVEKNNWVMKKNVHKNGQVHHELKACFLWLILCGLIPLQKKNVCSSTQIYTPKTCQPYYDVNMIYIYIQIIYIYIYIYLYSIDKYLTKKTPFLGISFLFAAKYIVTSVPTFPEVTSKVDATSCKVGKDWCSMRQGQVAPDQIDQRPTCKNVGGSKKSTWTMNDTHNITVSWKRRQDGKKKLLLIWFWMIFLKNSDLSNLEFSDRWWVFFFHDVTSEFTQKTSSVCLLGARHQHGTERLQAVFVSGPLLSQKEEVRPRINDTSHSL